MTSFLQKSPFVRIQRNFPNDDIKTLSVEMDRAHIEYAQRINDRTIGIFAENIGVQTGDKWYLAGSNQPQQTIRYTYSFTTFANIDLGFQMSSIDRIIQMYGCFTDGTYWMGLIPATDSTIANQVTFYINIANNQIVFNNPGAKTITKGNIVIEWLALF